MATYGNPRQVILAVSYIKVFCNVWKCMAKYSKVWQHMAINTGDMVYWFNVFDVTYMARYGNSRVKTNDIHCFLSRFGITYGNIFYPNIIHYYRCRDVWMYGNIF